MRKHPFVKALACLALLAATSHLRADLASTSASWLLLPSDPRSAAMAGAGVAVADDVNGLLSNPAGLPQLQGQQASFMHNSWMQGIASEHLAYGLALPGLGQAGAAVSFDYLNFGSINKYTVNNGTLAANGSFSPSAYHFDLAYGQQFGPLSGGVNLKYLGQSVDTDSSASFGADLGALWKPGLAGLSLGLALQNLGAQLDGANLPTDIKAGSAWATSAGEGNKLTLAADLTFPAADSGSTSFGVGGEFWYQGLIAGRAGYKAAKTGTLDGLSGLTLGLGFKYRFAELDYALVTEGDLGASNLFSVLVSF
jgi:hypothetical protein